MKNNFLYIITLFIFYTYSSFGQDKDYDQDKDISVKLIDEKIEIDGVLDEAIWSEAMTAKDFWQYFPSDTVLSKEPTEIKMLYDDKYLYVGIKVYAAGEDYIIPSLRRDYSARGNDNINLLFDTFNDGSIAFFFGINPYGVRREALIAGGGADFRNFNRNWDVTWYGESKIYKGYYTSELKIPLASFKFKEGENKWRFNSYKFDTQSNEWSSWIRIPQNQTITNLAFMGDMIFEKPLGDFRTPFALIPYVSSELSKIFVDGTSVSKIKFGGDAKIPIGNSLNLDLTINPDFSNVEVDEQLVNITRFELFLPEKRQFFMDNSDLFADFGNSREANPFFSRRIGIARDKNGLNIENPLLAGLRLSGKLNQNLRIGAMNVQTDEDIENEIPTNNNTVIALQQKVFSRSNIGFIFINRQVTKDRDFVTDSEKYNRVVGLDFNLASEDNTWIGKYYLHKSFTPEAGDNDISSGGFLEYNKRKIKATLGATFVGEDFQSDLGFIRRKDIFRVDPRVEVFIYPESKKINRYSFALRANSFWKPELNFKNSDYSADLSWNMRFEDQTDFRVGINTRYTFLFSDFDPTRSGGVPLPENTGYNYSSVNFAYNSDRRKDFTYFIRSSAGQFYNGIKYSMTTDLGYRAQPYFTTSIRIDYNYIELPDPHPTASIWLIGPRLEFTFNKNLYWSTFIQYSTQLDNFSINSRLQWRFKPLSDLFIVYNDNYQATVFSPRSRALFLKFTYWINI
jgi:uncharacterized protein DUF5916